MREDRVIASIRNDWGESHPYLSMPTSPASCRERLERGAGISAEEPSTRRDTARSFWTPRAYCWSFLPPGLIPSRFLHSWSASLPGQIVSASPLGGPWGST